MSKRAVNEDTIRRVAEQATFGTTYVMFMVGAGVLSAVALLTNSVPVLIGSMVVAPVLAPVALVAFALVGRRPRAAWQGAWVALSGLLLAAGAAILTTLLMNATGVLPADANLLEKPLLEERVKPGWYSVAVALAAGMVGVIALAQEKRETLVGVVAAVALVPAAAAAGIALLSKDPTRALGGLGLLGINVGMIVIAGIATLLVLRPDAGGRPDPGS